MRIRNTSQEEKNWQKLEQSYIKLYNTQVPNGYNVTPGGERPPVHYGEDNYKTKLSEQDLLKLKDELVEGTEFISDLAIKYHLSSSQVERINAGEFRIHPDWDYPLRKLTPWETK